MTGIVDTYFSRWAQRVTLGGLGFLAGLMGLAGCGETAESEPVEATYIVSFKAMVGELVFECGKTYQGLGKDQQDTAFTDFRLFVHDVRLVDEDGVKHDLTLTNDDVWQAQGVALLDFEDGCENGTKEVNLSVSGLATIGTIAGIEFSLGVPNELNSPMTMLEGRGSPLNQSSLFWSWKSGYKFVRLDSDLRSFRFHLGSTGCSDDFVCTHENIPVIRLNDFDPSKHAVVLDVRSLLAESILGENTKGTAPGCMGEPADPDCTGIFEKLGVGSERKSGAVKTMPVASEAR